MRGFSATSVSKRALSWEAGEEESALQPFGSPLYRHRRDGEGVSERHPIMLFGLLIDRGSSSNEIGLEISNKWNKANG